MTNIKNDFKIIKYDRKTKIANIFAKNVCNFI